MIEVVNNRLVQKIWTRDEFGRPENNSIELSNGTLVLVQGRVVLSDNVDIESAGRHHAVITVASEPEDPRKSSFYFVYEQKGRLRLVMDRVLERFGIDTRWRRY